MFAAVNEIVPFIAVPGFPVTPVGVIVARVTLSIIVPRVTVVEELFCIVKLLFPVDGAGVLLPIDKPVASVADVNGDTVDPPICSVKPDILLPWLLLTVTTILGVVGVGVCVGVCVGVGVGVEVGVGVGVVVCVGV